MNSLNARLVPLCICAFIVVSPVLEQHTSAQVPLFPPGGLRTLSTEHFTMLFPERLAPVARQAAAIAEQVHAELAPRLQWTPTLRTWVLISDHIDVSNAMTTTVPHNWILIYTVPPAGDSELGSYDNWLRLLIAHEYTHVLQLDSVGGLFKALRLIFGRYPLLFPGFLQPVWLIEGLAVYEETQLTGYGRIDAAYTDMIIRAAVADEFPNRAQANGFQPGWPTGHTPYLFGGRFLNFIANRYGRAKVEQLMREYNNRTWPLRPGANAKRILGKSFEELWSEWLAAETARAGAIDPAWAPRRLTDSGHINWGPRYLRDGSGIIYTRLGPDTDCEIRRLGPDGRDRGRISKRNYGDTLGALPDGQHIAYSQFQFHHSSSISRDIYLRNIERGPAERLTRNRHAYDPDPSPNGQELVCVIREQDGTRLALYDLTQRELTAITAAEPQVRFFQPRFSPDGETIAVSCARPGEPLDIVFFNRAGQEIGRIARDTALDASPTWAPDGSGVAFASDRSGRFQIHWWEKETGALKQVTHSPFGAFAPDISPSGSEIVFVEYSADGFEIATTTFAPVALDIVTASERRPDPPVEPPPVTGNTRPYIPLGSLLPRYWLLSGGADEAGSQIGIFTHGLDAAWRHEFTASLLYGLDSERWAGMISYQYLRFIPSLTLDYVDNAFGYDFEYTGSADEEAELRTRWERHRRMEATLGFPWQRWSFYAQLDVGLFSEELEDLGGYAFWPGMKSDVEINGWVANALLTTARQFPRSISATDGVSVQARYRSSVPNWTNDRIDMDSAVAQAAGYIPLGKHHVLAMRLSGGWSDGAAVSSRVFRMGGPAALSLEDPDLPADFPLRGYDPYEFWGDRAVTASLEYRFPLVRPETGTGNGWLFLNTLSLAAFADGGWIWDGQRDIAAHLSDCHASAGIECSLFTRWIYLMPLQIRVGTAARLDGEEDKDEPVLKSYIQIGPAF